VSRMRTLYLAYRPDGEKLSQAVTELASPISAQAVPKLKGSENSAQAVPNSRGRKVAQPVGQLARRKVAQRVGQLEAAELPDPLAEIPWGHNVLLLFKLTDRAERLWYAEQTVAHGWSRAVLTVQIETDLYGRQGKAVTNFAKTLPPPQSDLAQQTLKDPYVFDFLTIGDDAFEREMEGGLLAHIEKFLVELECAAIRRDARQAGCGGEVVQAGERIRRQLRRQAMAVRAHTARCDCREHDTCRPGEALRRHWLMRFFFQVARPSLCGLWGRGSAGIYYCAKTITLAEKKKSDRRAHGLNSCPARGQLVHWKSAPLAR
jgi:predicted nuclease of restriction endonuclease-like (RecB) superfamily